MSAITLSAEVVHLDEHMEAYLLETYFNEQVRMKKDLQLA